MASDVPEPPQRCLVARWFAFHWETRCVTDAEVPALLTAGWLNYMRDPFDQEDRRQWAMDRRDARWSMKRIWNP